MCLSRKVMAVQSRRTIGGGAGFTVVQFWKKVNMKYKISSCKLSSCVQFAYLPFWSRECRGIVWPWRSRALAVCLSTLLRRAPHPRNTRSANLVVDISSSVPTLSLCFVHGPCVRLTRPSCSRPTRSSLFFPFSRSSQARSSGGRTHLDHINIILHRSSPLLLHSLPSERVRTFASRLNQQTSRLTQN